MKNTVRPSVQAWPDVLAVALILLACVLIVWHAADRQYANVNTETDFVGGFTAEAARFMKGQPLKMEFHPPAYPIALAASFAMVNDWFTAGLIISAVCAVVALVTSYLCFRELGGSTAGLGALAAMLASAAFLSYSIQSTSDMFFMALWCAALWMTVVALGRQRSWQWAAAGLLIGVAVLARANGVVLLLLAVAPLIGSRKVAERVVHMLIVMTAIGAPLVVWYVYSSKTGSPFMPTKTYANLALTYFSEGSGISGDFRIPLESQFSSSWDVLAKDPLHVLKTYLRDLVRLPRLLLREATLLPLALLGAVCCVAWLTRLRDPRALAVIGVTFASIALLNMKTFEVRFYLFLLPVVGASLGIAWTWIAQRRGATATSMVAGNVGLAAVAIVGLAVSGHTGFARAEDPRLSKEFGELIPHIAAQTPADALIMCRKCSAAFHAGRTTLRFPPMETLEELCIYLESVDPGRSTYIAIAEMERRMRPELARQLLDDPLPAWLELTAEGSMDDPWRLIRYLDEHSCR